ncbi:MAG: YqgE/AlgH family protein [Alphaproteobacteria bacterium]|jgi:putative transcriptional regulator|nr:YqgE/AlgH family protein [Alphaproteobacteria bacterium]MCZ6511043.1 YqgE/AlgH family protein [Alphaproteobacteria bacterium]MCZ6589202.1 YqgE/AlgH family protein [Alphaproteobacteria bacterium]MCZ6590828.1 YqgE/AlgH family protein [Alphaproteobacteria bacterium]MCZ6838819.1 YqgE/AlgH family protein [Alphaproteobacteria bacterium]
MQDSSTESAFLEGKLLIAMPAMTDPRFERSVIYVCTHNSDGAMGLVVNKLFDEIDFRGLLTQLEITPAETSPKLNIHFGGPVESQRGFVLHTAEYVGKGTVVVDDHVALTATLDILKELAEGNGPKSTMLALGYAGWGPGQLEFEFSENAWLHAPFDEALVFDGDVETKWNRALNSIGVDISSLSGSAGRA